MQESPVLGPPGLPRDGVLGTRGPRKRTKTGGQSGERGRERMGGDGLHRAGSCSTGRGSRRWPHGGDPSLLDSCLFPVPLRSLYPNPMERRSAARCALSRGHCGYLCVGCCGLEFFFNGIRRSEGFLSRRDVSVVASHGLRFERAGAARIQCPVRFDGRLQWRGQRDPRGVGG